MRKEAARWLAQSAEDLESAEATLVIKRYYVASLLAQQAAEKALKAVFIQRKRALPPRTHYLEDLGQAVETPDRLQAALQNLTPVYFSSRYPDAHESTTSAERFTKELSAQHVDLARSIVLWATQQLRDAS